MLIIGVLVASYLVWLVGIWGWKQVPVAYRPSLQAALGYGALSLFAVVFVGPFIWMLSTSLKTDTQVLTSETHWIPTIPTQKVRKTDENGISQETYQPIMALGREAQGGRRVVVLDTGEDGTSKIQDVTDGKPGAISTVQTSELHPLHAVAPQWHNYPDALTSFPFVRYTLNTLIICVLTMIGTLISAALPAYGFARLRWKGRDVMFVVLLATIMLPPQVTMLPVFLIFRALGWTGTMLPLVVPAFFGSAFYIFLLRQFFLTVPQELSDAARIDGCSELGILWRILTPIARPALATVALLSFTSAWMDFSGPLIYLHDENTYTLAIGLLAFLGRHNGEWNLLMAASMVMTVPMLVLFFFAQRTYIQGIALTGLKG